MTTPTQKDLLMALLSMDAYNQGYEPTIDHKLLKIGASEKSAETDTGRDTEAVGDGDRSKAWGHAALRSGGVGFSRLAT